MGSSTTIVWSRSAPSDTIAIGTGPEGRDGHVERFDASGQPIDDE